MVYNIDRRTDGWMDGRTKGNSSTPLPQLRLFVEKGDKIKFLNLYIGGGINNLWAEMLLQANANKMIIRPVCWSF